MSLKIDSMGTTQCLMCFNNTEKCILFPMEDTEKILNNCLTYLNPSIAIKPVCNNDQLFFCNHCFDFASELNKLEGRLEILQNRLSNLSSTFSRAIMCRRQLFSKRKKETSKRKTNTVKMTKKSTLSLNVSAVSLISSVDSSNKTNKIYLIQPKQNYTIIGSQLQDNIRGDLAETDLSDPVIAPSCQNLLLNVKSETNTYNSMDTIDSIEDPFIDKDILNEVDSMDILIHKNLPNPNTYDKEEDIIDIENIKCESDSRFSSNDLVEAEEGVTNLQENQSDFPPSEKDFTNNARKDKDDIVNSEDDDDIIILSDSESETSKSTESLKKPIILLDTVRHVGVEETNKADEMEIDKTTDKNTGETSGVPSNTSQSPKDDATSSKNVEATSTPTDKIRPFKCTTCQQSFMRKSNLQNHKRIHTGEKPYKCLLCIKRFRTSGLLSAHKKTHMCPFCSKSFSDKEELEFHKKTHQQLMEYQTFSKKSMPKCRICGKRFTSTTALKMHQKIHNRAPVYKCSLCDEVFSDTFKLKEHERFHTGEKPFECSFCTMTFASIDILIKHESIHEEEGEEQDV